MPFKKGKSGNPAGKKKGTPNKVTADLKQWLQKIIDDNREVFEEDLRVLEPEKRLVILERLMQYVIPKQQSVSIEAQMRAEYAELERLLTDAPEEAVNLIIERIGNLKNLNDGKETENK